MSPDPSSFWSRKRRKDLIGIDSQHSCVVLDRYPLFNPAVELLLHTDHLLVQIGDLLVFGFAIWLRLIVREVLAL
jgi:hypothetical protein